MQDVKFIEDAVRSLPPAQLAEFRRWFAAFDADIWDQQVERVVAGGKLDAMADEALADDRAAPAREL